MDCSQSSTRSPRHASSCSSRPGRPSPKSARPRRPPTNQQIPRQPSLHPLCPPQSLLSHLLKHLPHQSVRGRLSLSPWSHGATRTLSPLNPTPAQPVLPPSRKPRRRHLRRSLCRPVAPVTCLHCPESRLKRVSRRPWCPDRSLLMLLQISP